MRIFFGFIALLSAFSSVQGQIVETGHFHEVLKQVDRDTLVILDIDDTLLIPEQMLGCDEWFMHQFKTHKKAGLDEHQALEKTIAEWEAIRHLTKMCIVEPGAEKIVSLLQEQGCCVMGLTTQGLALATRTVEQLKENGLDLSLSTPSGKDHFLLLHDHGVLYRKGILFTSGIHKGEAFFAFCKTCGYNPKKIVFVNDKASHIREIELEADKRGVGLLDCVTVFLTPRKRHLVLKLPSINLLIRHSATYLLTKKQNHNSR